MTTQLESSIVRIRTTDGTTVGAGFLMTDWQVLACAQGGRSTRSARGHLASDPEEVNALVHPELMSRPRLIER